MAPEYHNAPGWLQCGFVLHGGSNSSFLIALQSDSWEEKWEEHYTASGAANKYADKWGKDGPNVWHERWGEDYNGGGGCVKYTDKVDPNINSLRNHVVT